MRLSLIGPGDIKYHFQELLKIPKKKFKSELEKIAQALVDSGVEIELLPDKGISFEIAKIYKQKGGKKVIAAIPQSDKTFGIKHLEQFINSEIIDEKVNTGDWYKHDLIKGLLGNAVLYLGNSPGTNGELNYAVYLYKILTGRKEGVEIAGKFIHSEIRAGKDYTIFVYSPFLKSGKLSEELENYIRKFNISLVYINNPNQLRDKLRSF